MLSISDNEMANKLSKYRANLTNEVLEKNKNLNA
jgi:phosphoribosylcarboxyaminoimidazole (NCAIR) mutase